MSGSLLLMKIWETLSSSYNQSPCNYSLRALKQGIKHPEWRDSWRQAAGTCSTRIKPRCVCVIQSKDVSLCRAKCDTDINLDRSMAMISFTFFPYRNSFSKVLPFWPQLGPGLLQSPDSNRKLENVWCCEVKSISRALWPMQMCYTEKLQMKLNNKNYIYR